jgi:WD40 repeat protein
MYTPDGTRFVVGSRDGTVVEWSDDGDTHHDLGAIHEPVAFVSILPSSESIVIGGISGALWLYFNGSMNLLGKETTPMASVAISHDSRWLAIGTTRGIVHLYNLITREVSTHRSPRPWIEFLAFSPDSKELAIATDKSVNQIALPRSIIRTEFDTNDSTMMWRWNEIELSVRYFSFSPDGKWFAATCDHGGVWFNRRGDNHWIYRSTGTARVAFGYFSEDGTQFVATDVSGRALIVDMRARMFN